MFTQSKQLTAALVVSTVLTSVGIGLFVSALNCDCEHEPECRQAAAHVVEPPVAKDRLAAAEPEGQLAPEVIMLEPDTVEIEQAVERALGRHRAHMLRQRRTKSQAQRRALADPFSPDYWKLKDTSESELASHGPKRAVRVVDPSLRSKKAIRDPWAD